jgi:hypothetical protein
VVIAGSDEHEHEVVSRLRRDERDPAVLADGRPCFFWKPRISL